MLKNNYRHIFFDLDHTLWDFENNATAVLLELHQELDLKNLGCNDAKQFVDTFHEINLELWRLHDLDEIDIHDLRHTRFTRVFDRMGLKKVTVPPELGDLYLERCPQGKLVLPHAHDVLAYLHDKYRLHIITNGFDDIQQVKLKSASLDNFFDVVVTAGGCGYKKPDKKIFDYALQQTGASAELSLMVGDNLDSDIIGAQNAGIDHIFFNPGRTFHQHQVDHEIYCLSELKNLI